MKNSNQILGMFLDDMGTIYPAHLLASFWGFVLMFLLSGLVCLVLFIQAPTFELGLLPG